MENKTLLSIIIGVVILAILGFGIYFFTTSYQPTTKSSVGTETVTTNSVSIKNFAFDPADIKVAKGSTVTWTNNDAVNHELKSDQFQSQSLNPGDQFTFTFVNTGKVSYHCSIHPSMTGSVTVE